MQKVATFSTIFTDNFHILLPGTQEGPPSGELLRRALAAVDDKMWIQYRTRLYLHFDVRFDRRPPALLKPGDYLPWIGVGSVISHAYKETNALKADCLGIDHPLANGPITRRGTARQLQLNDVTLQGLSLGGSSSGSG